MKKWILFYWGEDDSLARWWMTRPYAQRMVRAYQAGVITRFESEVRRHFWFWRWN